MTVSGLTMIWAERQSRQVAAKHAQKNRTDAISFPHLTERSKNVELVPKSKHLHLKRTTAVKAIPRRCQNGPYR
jgi:hypothetical protein